MLEYDATYKACDIDPDIAAAVIVGREGFAKAIKDTRCLGP